MGDLLVPFALLSDDRLVHITEVRDSSDGPFACPGCRGALLLKNGRVKRPHFAHARDAGCPNAAESGLHLYAKELLNRTKSIVLPPVTVPVDGRERVAHAGGRYAFDHAEMEVRREGYRPDLVLHGPQGSLVIEVKVRHAVDETKREKLRAAGVSAIEIDLGGLYRVDLPLAVLDEAIVATAPRAWLANRRAGVFQRKLEAREKARRQEKARNFRRWVESRPREQMPAERAREIDRIIERHGLGRAVGLSVAGAHWFSEPATRWQGAVLCWIVDRATVSSARPLRIRDIPVTGLGERLVRSDLPPRPSARLLADAGLSDAYGSPSHAIWWYLTALAERELVIEWDRFEGCWHLREDVHERIYRAGQIERLVLPVLTHALGADEAHRVFESWRADWGGEGGQSPAALIAKGGAAYEELVRRLTAIQAMLYAYPPSAPDDLCGFPLEALREQRRADKEARDAKIEAEKRAAIQSRRNAFEQEARRLLGPEADAWLAVPVADGASGDRLTEASLSSEAIERAYRALDRAAHLREDRLAAERRSAAALAELEVAALGAFPSPAHAELFLRTLHPRLGSKRPVDYCHDAATLRHCLALLPMKR